MVGGEPTLVYWRVQDLREAPVAAWDIGLSLTSLWSVADKLLGLTVHQPLGRRGRPGALCRAAAFRPTPYPSATGDSRVSGDPTARNFPETASEPVAEAAAQRGSR